MAITNNLGQTKVGVRSFVFAPEEPGTPMTIDQDSTNFIIYSGLSDSVQISAIETLVSDLKTYGLWTKMRAIYPFVGGSAASHKLNLKDPRNLDAAYRLNFYGGWTHTNNGAQPNGTTGYADSKYNPSINGQLNSAHISYYSRTNTSSSNAIDMGALSAAPGNYHHMHIRYTGDLMFGLINTSSAVSVSNNISQGLFISSRINSTNISLYRNNSNIGNVSLNSTTQPNNNIYIGAGNITNSPQQYSSKESSFVSIGDGLTDTEAANFYTAVQKFQTTLGRHVGIPIVADGDAQAFLNAASITDLTQATAVNKLVTDLKSAGIWTKMKALYPFVGGSAASHRFNLKDPRTVDAAFYLDFYGGVTHTSAGATFNGTTGYADMKLMRSQLFTNTDGMIGMYTPTLSSSGSLFAVSNMANADFSGYYNGTQLSNNMYPNTSVSYTTQLKGFNCFDVFINVVTCRSIFKNGVKVAFGSGYSNISPDYKVYMAATNRAGSSYGDNFAGVYSFSFFSNTLTSSENIALYNAVQAFQTTLGRAV